MTQFPLTLVHPSYQKSQITPFQNGRFTDHAGTPDRYPPVTVHNPDQEERHRAMGYVAYGEAPKMTPYSEYPLMLVHPDHVPAKQAETHAKREENGSIITWVTPGTEGKLHPVQVATSDEEEAWTAKGYGRPGKADRDAVQAQAASPHVPGRVVEEFPKMVGGTDAMPIIVGNPVQRRHSQYPMWLSDGRKDKNGDPTGKVVNNEEEHQALRPGDFEPKAEIDASAPAVAAETPPAAVAGVDPAEHQKALDELASLRERLAAKDAARDRMAKARAGRTRKPGTGAAA